VPPGDNGGIGSDWADAGDVTQALAVRVGVDACIARAQRRAHLCPVVAQLVQQLLELARQFAVRIQIGQ